MDLHLKDKTVLVTASTGGIGLEIAKSFAREDARVIINGRTEKGVKSALSEILDSLPEANLLPLVADMGTAKGVALGIKSFPAIDILVNNLGIYEPVPFFEESDDSWLHLFEVNILSGVRLSRYYLPGMIERNKGRIIFISSESAIMPAPEMVHYSATKAMQLSLSRSLAELTKGTNVTVNAILPGSTLTPGVIDFITDLYPDLPFGEAESRFIEQNRSTSLIQRLIRPAEVASFVAYVASPHASAINGAALRVDGGLIRSIV